MEERNHFVRTLSLSLFHLERPLNFLRLSKSCRIITTTMMLRQEGQLRVLVAGGWSGGDLASTEVSVDEDKHNMMI